MLHIFVNIPLLSHRWVMPYFCLVFRSCSNSQPVFIPSPRSSMESSEMVSQTNWEEWVRREAKDRTISVLVLCMHQLSWTYRSETFPTEGNHGNFNIKMFSYDLHFHGFFFFFHFLSFPPIIISPSVDLYPCCIFIRPDLELPVQTKLLWKSASLHRRQQDLAQSVTF